MKGGRSQRNGRDPYAVAGTAGRAAIDRALGATPELSAGEWRALVVVLRFTTTYSKVEDGVYLSQIAGALGRSPRQARRWMQRLAAKGLIRWQPGVGRSPSRIGLQEGDSARCEPVPSERTAASASVSPLGTERVLSDETEPDAIESTQRGRDDARGCPPSEKVSMKYTENFGAADNTNGEHPTQRQRRKDAPRVDPEFEERRRRAARAVV